MKLLRILLGAVVGYVLSLLTSYAWFALTRQEPTQPASHPIIVATILSGILFSVVAGYVASYIADSWIGAAALAVLILVIATFSIAEAHSFGAISLWSLKVAIFAMAPAALAGGILRRH